MGEMILKINHLSKAFGSHEVLRDIDFTVNKGDVTSIIGAYLGAGLAIKNGSRIVRPTVILVLILLTAKVGSELLFPEFWA